MGWLKFKLVCYCNGSITPSDMTLIEDDMEWVFECPKCRTQIGVQNWTCDENEKDAINHKEPIKGEIMICDKCQNKPSMHSVGERRLCCECYVKEDNPPADWHPECMKTYEEMPGKFEYHVKIVNLDGKDRVAVPETLFTKYHISDAEYKYFDIKDAKKLRDELTAALDVKEGMRQ